MRGIVMKVLEESHASPEFIETRSNLSAVNMTWCRKREEWVLAK